jgi:hypothetical protein
MYSHNDCLQRVRVFKPPADFVDAIVPAIEHCGFFSEERPDKDPTRAPSLRLANPGLELMWWVRIDVTGYNVTRADKTDKAILCLHRIGNMGP